MPGGADQSYKTNSTFQRDSNVMPIGIHERGASSGMIDPTMVGGAPPIRDVAEPQEDFRMGQMPQPGNYGKLQ